MSNIIQADYEALQEIAILFGKEAVAVELLYQHVLQRADQLRGAWVGEVAEAFFNELDSEVLPATARLREALIRAEETTHTIELTIC